MSSRRHTKDSPASRKTNQVLQLAFLLSFAFLFTNCIKGQEMTENEYKENINKELTTLLRDNSNTVEKIERYFKSRNIEYEWRDKPKSDYSRIYNKTDAADRVCFAVYHSQKDGLVNAQYVVYIILDETKKMKDIIFDVFYTGP